MENSPVAKKKAQEKKTPDSWTIMPEGARVLLENGIVHLEPQNALIQPLIFADLSGKFVTVSMEDANLPLSVSIGNQQATFYSGNGRRQASLRIPKNYLGEFSLQITNLNDEIATLSKVKLEIGEAKTAF